MPPVSLLSYRQLSSAIVSYPHLFPPVDFPTFSGRGVRVR
jgi:hypothetical protein